MLLVIRTIIQYFVIKIESFQIKNVLIVYTTSYNLFF